MVFPQSKVDAFSAEDIDLLPYPAFLLDDNRVITARNKASKMRTYNIYVRSKIDRHISRKMIAEIKAMEPGDELFLDLELENTYGAILHRFREGYCLAIRTITAYMMKYVAELATKLPKFFSSVDNQIINLRMAQFRTPDELVAVRKRHNQVLRYQTSMATYFALTSGKMSKSTVSEISMPINNLIEGAVRILRPNGIVASTKLHEMFAFVNGSADLARYAVATMISVAAENVAHGHFRIETRAMEGDFIVLISFEHMMDEELLRGFTSEYYCGDLLSGAYADAFFDLLLIQMLSEVCGWRFSVGISGLYNNLLALTLYIPITHDEPFLLNSPPDSMPLLEIQLANILAKQED